MTFAQLRPLALGLALAACGSGSTAVTAPDATTGASEAAGGRDAHGGHGGSASDGGAGSNGVCSFSRTPVAPLPVDAYAPLQARAEAAQLATLDRLIGRYLRGEVLVYRGTMHAHDNASALANPEAGGMRPDGAIAEGPALALLQTRMSSRGDMNPPPLGRSAFLVVYDLAERKHVIFEQPQARPRVTEVSLVTPFVTTAGMITSCTACAPNLWETPASIALGELTATGVVSVFMGTAGKDGRQVDVTARTVASAALTNAAPCTLQFQELVLLSSSPGPDELELTLTSFTPSGDELVWHTAGAFDTASTPCPTTTPYKIDVYVDTHDLSHYGTRNFTLGTPGQACPP
jgi:hypothetical protein